MNWKNYGNFALLDSSDEEIDSPHHLYDSFYNAIGAEGIHKMTDFTPLEVQTLYDMFQAVMNPFWRRCWESLCTYDVFDVQFMTLPVLETGGTWNFLAAVFKIISSKLQLMISKFVDRIGNHAYKVLLLIYVRSLMWIKLTMTTTCLKITLKHFMLAM